MLASSACALTPRSDLLQVRRVPTRADAPYSVRTLRSSEVTTTYVSDVIGSERLLTPEPVDVK